MVVISVMMSLAHTVLTFVGIIQFIIMLVAGRQPNKSLVDFGATLGIWIAKATHYQTVASDVRPWPWSELA
jgi:succinate-acetate transporter protein